MTIYPLQPFVKSVQKDTIALLRSYITKAFYFIDEKKFMSFYERRIHHLTLVAEWLSLDMDEEKKETFDFCLEDLETFIAFCEKFVMTLQDFKYYNSFERWYILEEVTQFITTCKQSKGAHIHYPELIAEVIECNLPSIFQ